MSEPTPQSSEASTDHGRFAAHKLTDRQRQVLEAVSAGHNTATLLAAHLAVSDSAAQQMVKRLHREGHLRSSTGRPRTFHVVG